MACAVLTDAGTPYIYCVGGSAAGQTTTTDRVFGTTQSRIVSACCRSLAGCFDQHHFAWRLLGL
jgi:hypothetical protein